MRRDRFGALAAAVAGGQSASAWAHLSDSFGVGAADPTARAHGGRSPWAWYRQDAVEVGSVAAGVLDLIPLEGGGTTEVATGQSWWFGAGPGTRRSGMLLYKLVGPGSPRPTPRDFSVRARLIVSNEAGDGPPPGGPGVYTFGGIAMHNPIRPPTGGATFSYDHAALGTDPATPRGYEVKTTQNDVSTFPVIAAADVAPGSPILADVRLDRVGQIVRGYFRAGHATALEVDAGFVLHTTIDHTTGAPGTEVETLADTLDVGFMAYSNVEGAGSPSGADVRLRCAAILFSGA